MSGRLVGNRGLKEPSGVSVLVCCGLGKERAATNFVQALQFAAARAIEEADQVRLTLADQQAFAHALTLATVKQMIDRSSQVH